MSGVLQMTKKIVTAPKRAWSNRFLPMIGRRSAVPADQQSEHSDDDASERDLALRAIAGEGEQIHRRVGIGPITLGHTKDEGYKTRVADPVEALLARVDELSEADQSLDWEAIQQAVKLRGTLETEMAHYADRVGGARRPIADQRSDKADAIRRRIEALDDLLEREADASQDVQSHLLFAAKDTNAALSNVISKYGEDVGYMENLCRTMLDRQVSSELDRADREAAKRNILRNDNVATATLRAYVEGSADGKAYIAEMDQEVRATLTKLVPAGTDIEIDQAKADKAASRPVDTGPAVDRMADLVSTLLDHLIAKPVPNTLAITADMMAVVARDNGLSDQPDDDEVARLIGAHVMLRIVCPTISKMMTDKSLSDDQRRAAMLANKTIINFANGLRETPKDASISMVMRKCEDYFDIIQQWMKSVADEGAQLRSGQGGSSS